MRFMRDTCPQCNKLATHICELMPVEYPLAFVDGQVDDWGTDPQYSDGTETASKNKAGVRLKCDRCVVEWDTYSLDDASAFEAEAKKMHVEKFAEDLLTTACVLHMLMPRNDVNDGEHFTRKAAIEKATVLFRKVRVGK